MATGRWRGKCPRLSISERGNVRGNMSREKCPAPITLDGVANLAPVTDIPSYTRPVNVTSPDGVWSRLVYASISADRCVEGG